MYLTITGILYGAILLQDIKTEINLMDLISGSVENISLRGLLLAAIVVLAREFKKSREELKEKDKKLEEERKDREEVDKEANDKYIEILLQTRTTLITAQKSIDESNKILQRLERKLEA